MTQTGFVKGSHFKWATEWTVLQIYVVFTCLTAILNLLIKEVLMPIYLVQKNILDTS